MSEIRKLESGIEIVPDKNIVSDHTDSFKKELLNLIDADNSNLIINMENVDLIDSMGIGVLVAAQNTLTKKSGQLTLTNLSENIYKLFCTMRLNSFLNIEQ